MLKIASRPENLSELDEVLHVLKEKFNIDRNTYMNIRLSLTEAVNNAIIHGNCRDCTKYVSLTIKETSHKLTFIVQDEGPGFNVNEVPNPLEEENLECEGGRGVFLIKELCDQVSFKDNGSTLKMSFAI